jgi:YggT family protein
MMDILIVPIFNCILVALNLYQYAIMAYVILGWLELFKLVNPYSNVIYSIHNFLFSIVEPALIQIRRFLPNGMVIDISPFILVLSIYFIQDVLGRLIGKVIG